MEGECLEGGDQHLALGLQCLRKSILLSVPKGVDGVVRVDEKVVLGEMEVVEVVSLEDGLNFTILELLCLGVLVSVGLDYSRVALVLAQEDEVLLADCIE
jgi:hypothetical protein